MKFLRSVPQSRESVTERIPAGLRGVMRIATKIAPFLIACLSTAIVCAVQSPDSEYESVAEEYIKGFLAARPIFAN